MNYGVASSVFDITIIIINTRKERNKERNKQRKKRTGEEKRRQEWLGQVIVYCRENVRIG